MSRRKPPYPPPSRKLIEETVYLKRPRKGARLREDVWVNSADGKVTRYALAYINLKRCPVDNGRVLGYDNSHGYHHRHFMGEVEPFAFEGYSALFERFHKEVHELWRKEDESET